MEYHCRPSKVRSSGVCEPVPVKGKQWTAVQLCHGGIEPEYTETLHDFLKSEDKTRKLGGPLASQRCKSVNDQRNLDAWCESNCKVGFCPTDKCKCEDTSGEGSSEEDTSREDAEIAEAIAEADKAAAAADAAEVAASQAEGALLPAPGPDEAAERRRHSPQTAGSPPKSAFKQSEYEDAARRGSV